MPLEKTVIEIEEEFKTSILYYCEKGRGWNLYICNGRETPKNLPPVLGYILMIFTRCPEPSSLWPLS